MPPIEPGEKFACLAFRFFSLADVLHEEVNLGYGCWALPGPPLPLDDQWRAWLGEIEADQVEESNLVLFAKSTSLTPIVVDAEMEALQARVQYLHWGIVIAAGIPSYEHAVIIAGGNDGGAARVRTVGALQRIWLTHGAHGALVAVPHFGEACDITTRIEVAYHARLQDSTYRRVMRGLNAFVAGLRSQPGDVRLHQFVRAIESFAPPGTYRADGFVDCIGDLLPTNPDPSDVLRQLYNLRSAAEHHGDLDKPLGHLPTADRFEVANRRVRQAEALARSLFRRLLSVRSAYLHQFRDDDSFRRFWSQPSWVRRSIWGEGIDLQNVL
jgi:hypothetical protein